MQVHQSRSRPYLRLLLLAIAFVVLFGSLGVVGFYKFVLYNAPSVDVEHLPMDRKILITIPRGASLNQISHILQESRIIESASLFIVAAKFTKSERQLKAGQYFLPLRASNHQVLTILQNAVPQTIRVTIPEGKNAEFIQRIVHQKLNTDTTGFSRLLRDTALIKELGIDAPSLFGYLLPNTYFLDPGTSARDIIRIMGREFLSMYDDELRARTNELHMTIHEVVTLASIIEGETARSDERYYVSAVYHNRLRKKMLLQADPTVQFIIRDGPRRLFNKDLEIDSPYNTYKYPGLPPNPINNPGKASILAALFPADVDYLYMVSDGDGRHIFSKTLEEHLLARKQLDRIRQNLKRKKD